MMKTRTKRTQIQRTNRSGEHESRKKTQRLKRGPSHARIMVTTRKEREVDQKRGKYCS